MCRKKHNKAFSLVELMVAMAIMVLIFAAIVPQFRAIRNSWATTEESSTIIQNAGVLAEHINRNLATAKQIVSVSSSSIASGFIVFKDNLGATKKYMVSSGYVVFGDAGSEQQLAGPVSKFKISSYSINPSVALTTDANTIRLVKVETDFVNSSTGANKTFITSVYLPTNASTHCGLAGYWKFDETSGITAVDSSGNGNNGTLISMSSPSCWITGQIGGGLNYDGWNDYVNCGNGASLDITGDITIALWLYANNFNWDPDLITRGSYFTSYSIWATSSGYIRFSLDNDRLTSNTALSTGTWHHIAVTRGGNQRKIYINGQQDTSDTYGSPIGSTFGALNISTNSYPFNGIMDDVRIYDRALSAAEVAQLANTLRYMGSHTENTSNAMALSIGIPAGTSAGDLLIAAVARSGNAAILTPAGWTLIDQGNSSSGQVTLGVWRKIAGASEPALTFNLSGNQPAYGWMMRFTGHDAANPINGTPVAYNQTSVTPQSPAVTTTVNNCIILRLGAFDSGDITVGDPGLHSPVNHTAITMGKAGNVIFEDGFESNFFNKWTDGGTTDWDRMTDQAHSGSYSARGRKNDDYLRSDNIDTSTYNSFTVEFWYRDHRLDPGDNVYLQFYNGSTYNNIDNLGDDTSPEDTWYKYQTTITNVQYRKVNFRINFDSSHISNGSEYLWIDDVTISAGGVSGGAGYVKQSTAGSSGTSNFSLGSSAEARMLTIAIAPDSSGSGDCSGGQISP
ncbi:MAG: LamG-like jellyroll fold domain-containing protein [Phycisphaerae bacterium]|jgi:prepilin-type N-terminal cleavage/methylation domain-containing protein